jgi:hypothetical protein
MPRKYESDEERRKAQRVAGFQARKKGNGRPRGVGPLSVKQAGYVQRIAQGMTMEDAAAAAGYSRGSVRNLMRNGSVKSAIEEIRRKILESGLYGLQEAIARTMVLVDESRVAGQYTAAMRGEELLMRLCNLLVDRQEIEVEQRINLMPIIEAARMRVGLRDSALAERIALDDVEDARVLEETPRAVPVHGRSHTIGMRVPSILE